MARKICVRFSPPRKSISRKGGGEVSESLKLSKSLRLSESPNLNPSLKLTSSQKSYYNQTPHSRVEGLKRWYVHFVNCIYLNTYCVLWGVIAILSNPLIISLSQLSVINRHFQWKKVEVKWSVSKWHTWVKMTHLTFPFHFSLSIQTYIYI
jgi:hypothetical protein